jgi:hypothetical protein
VGEIPTEEIASRFARRHVAASPQPPRSVRWSEIAGPLYRAHDDRFLVLFGAALISFLGIGYFVLVEDPSLRLAALVLGGLVFGVACVAAPAALAFRVTRAIRTGLLVSATVLETEGAGSRVEGRLLVPHPSGSFEFGFSESAQIMDGVGPGSSVDVLVHPRRRRLLLVVGAARVDA